MLIRCDALSGRVKRLSALKMSSYHIHLSDDSGYALPSKAFPNLTSPHLALSLEDWQTLVATAAAYHVELVPEIDLPGHSSWIAKQLPELLGPTCSPGVSWCPIDTSPPALNRTVEIVSQIFEEVFALFKHSRYHHLGADEVYEDPRQVQPLLDCVTFFQPQYLCCTTRTRATTRRCTSAICPTTPRTGRTRRWLRRTWRWCGRCRRRPRGVRSTSSSGTR